MQQRKTKHIYLPCMDDCCTLDFYASSGFTFDNKPWFSISIMSDRIAGCSFFERLGYAWRILRGKSACYAQVMSQSKEEIVEFLDKCKQAVCEVTEQQS